MKEVVVRIQRRYLSSIFSSTSIVRGDNLATSCKSSLVTTPGDLARECGDFVRVKACNNAMRSDKTG